MAAPMRYMHPRSQANILWNLFGHVARNTCRRRECSSMVTNNSVRLDPHVESQIKDGSMKVKAHPGLVGLKTVKLPPRLISSIEHVIEKYPTKDLSVQSKKLFQYLWSRRKPVEEEELTYLAREAEEKAKAQKNLETLDAESKEAAEQKIRVQVLKNLRKHTYHWEPIDFHAYKGFVYMAARIALDYSSLLRVFSEIQKLDEDFQPESMYNSGSGVGSAVWAANSVWTDSLQEHFCVDPSDDMNTLARLLMQDGEEEKEMIFQNIYFRQFHPSSAERKHDLVVSAYTLIELPDQGERIKYLLNLWRKTDKYLVLVELGTNAGYQLIAEAREFLLQLSDESTVSKLRGPVRHENLAGHVFAPCPHDHVCPRLDSDLAHTPCNFPIAYAPLPLHKSPSGKEESRFSYVVLKKGQRQETAQQWPRVIRDTSRPSKRIHCRLCTHEGRLQHTVITAAKHGKELLQCARASKWGDLLPILPAEISQSQTEDINQSEAEDINQSEADEINQSESMNSKELLNNDRQKTEKEISSAEYIMQ